MSHNISQTLQVRASLSLFDSELFKQVQMSGIFSDSKTFADAEPKLPLEEILVKYQLALFNHSDFNLFNFVEEYFILPEQVELVMNKPNADINKQIQALWQTLKKPADQQDNSSLLMLNKPYIVPGGRFREIYYWDSFFTALGLVESNQFELVESMIDNFIDLQTRYGCIPNGNRSYYLSRSQPPILGLLIELLLPYQRDQQSFLQKYISGIACEYNFWMQGSDTLKASYDEHRRVVKMPDGSFLNRYWDDQVTPRPESYREDIELMHESNPEQPNEFYRNIRAACESGWDFSSRWLADEQCLASIQTTRILPVDLNCLLYKQEMLLGHYYSILGDNVASTTYLSCAKARKEAINRYLWSGTDAFFMDYNLDTKDNTSVKSLAGILPLFVELANQQQAEHVSLVIETEFLKKGGLITTCNSSGQQWDAPNGWAPLHWFSVQGLKKYQQIILAEIIQQRWLNTVEFYFKETGKLMEKYNVCQQSDKAEGGEYEVQEGFGWTNGVYQAFINQKNNRLI